MRVFVAGATGVIGRPLVAALREAGHDVVGMTRSAPGRKALEHAGARAVVCDALDRASLERIVGAVRPEAVVHQLTRIPQKINPRRALDAFGATNRLRREGTRNLLQAAMDAGARLFLAQSIAFAYRPGPDGLREESDPLFLDAPEAYRELIAAVAEMETMVTGAPGVQGTVLRYGFFYGPGTAYAPGGAFWQDAVRRRVPVIGSGDGVFSFVHVADAAAATVRAIEAGPARAAGIFNIVDDEPAPVREWLPELARIAGAKPPIRVPRWVGRLAAGPYGVHMMTAMPGASNRKAGAGLRWRPDHPSWRTGMRESG